jgi:hypothetical protein
MNSSTTIVILLLGMVSVFASIVHNIKEQHALMQQGIKSYVESQQVVFVKTNYRSPAVVADNR